MMRRRWHAITGAEAHAPAPSLCEAFGVWLLGVLWAMTCLWLAWLGSHWLLPGALVAGLFALWGWRHGQWLWWFPSGIVLGSALESIAPLAARPGFGTLRYADLLAIGVTVVALVRSIALDRPMLPRTPVDRAMAALLGCFALTLVLPEARATAFADAQRFLTTGVVFYATVGIASWPGGARWAWLAFPMAAGLTGAHVLWTIARDSGDFAGALAASGPAWGTSGAPWGTLLVSLSMGVGLAVNSGQVGLRRVYSIAWLAGFAALVALGLAGASPWTAHSADPLGSPHGLARTIASFAGLLALGAVAWSMRGTRAHEAPRWTATALTLALCGVGTLCGFAMRGPALLLLATAAGLVVATLRADRRTAVGLARPARPIAAPAARTAPASPAWTPPPGAPALSVVIVSYRSRDALEGCLESLAAARAELPLEVIVVDNASGDGTLEWVRDEHPWVAGVASPENVGFARGVNRGLAIARGEFLLVLNPDCEVTASALATLIETARREPRVAAVAPMLVDGQSRRARSCGRFPGLWSLCCDHLGLAQAFPRTKGFGGYKYGELPLESLDRVDWASGAALLIPRAAYRELGGLDENLFMYMEEVDWCRRAAIAGREIRFVPAARIVHHGQMSSKQVPGETYLHNLRSRVYYFRKHHGAPAAQVAKAILLTSLGLKWGVARVRAASRPWASIYARGVSAVWMA